MKPELRINSHIKLFAAYLLIVLIGSAMVTFINRVQLGLSWQDLLEYNLPALGIGDVLALACLQAISWLRLRAALRSTPGLLPEEQRALRVRALLRFPFEMAGGLFFLGLLYSFGYHGMEAVHYGFAEGDGAALLQNVLMEQSLCLNLTMLLFVLLRFVLKRNIRELSYTGYASGLSVSLTRLLGTAFAFSFLAAHIGVFFYAMADSPAGMPGVGRLLLLAAGIWLFAVSIFLLLISDLRATMAHLAMEIERMTRGSRVATHGKIPVVSTDESGRLVEEFNRLQEHFAAVYEETERELEAARDLQRSLLPPERRQIGGCAVAAVSRSCRDIGGDLYEVAELADGSFLVAIGDVSGKGMPAALMMAAVITLLRAELQRGGTPGEMATRLNRELCQVVPEGMYVTMGLGIFDTAKGTVAYASAGHLSPYRVWHGGTDAVPACSFPLGIDEETTYDSMEIPFAPGDWFVLYSDGCIDENPDSGDSSGFEPFERMLAEWYRTGHDEERHKRFVEHSAAAGSVYDDDRTIVIVRNEGAPQDKRRSGHAAAVQI